MRCRPQDELLRVILTSKNQRSGGRCHGMDKYTDLDIHVVKDESAATYDAWLGRDRIGTLVYQLTAGRVAMISIAVEPEYQHNGVAAELIARALDDVAATGSKVTIVCPAVRSFIDEHPAYADVVDDEHPGIRSRR